jgi:hypothetical protein
MFYFAIVHFFGYASLLCLFYVHTIFGVFDFFLAYIICCNTLFWKVYLSITAYGPQVNSKTKLKLEWSTPKLNSQIWYDNGEWYEYERYGNVIEKLRFECYLPRFWRRWETWHEYDLMIPNIRSTVWKVMLMISTQTNLLENRKQKHPKQADMENALFASSDSELTF